MPRLRTRIIAIAATGLASLLPLRAADAPQPAFDPSAPPLTLEQGIAQALARNFSVRIQKYSLDQADASVVIAHSGYDPVLGVTWQKNVSQSAAVASTLNAGVGNSALQTVNQQTTFSVNQAVITGGSISADYNLSRNATNSLYSVLNPAYDGAVSLNITQPLLQGAGTAYAEAAIKSAEIGRKIAGLNFKSTVLTMVYNVETAYYNLIFAREQYMVAQDTLKLAQQLLDENTVKRQTGVLTDLDVVQAQTGVATAKNQLIAVRHSMDNAQDTLLQALGEREFKFPVGEVSFPPLPDTNVSFDASYKLARENGPSLAVVQATIEQYKLSALRAKRNNLPQLNATAGGAYNTAEHSYADAASKVWNGNGYTWNAGLTLSFPWGLRSNKALYRQAMDSVASEQVALDEQDQALVVNVRNAIRAVQSDLEAVDAAGQEAVLSQKQYDLQKARFDAGLATSYDVLQAQNQLESARVGQMQAQVNLRTAVADLHFLEGTSLQAYHINLD
jgi:outer membrane protein TolC